MSETMTSGEIEDVLSSIRRLVSEDLRPVARPAQASLVSDDPARPAGKLILTPALRIVPPTAPEVPPDPPQTAAEPPEVKEPLVLGAPAASDETRPQTDDAPVPAVDDAAVDPWAHDETAATADDVQAWPGEGEAAALPVARAAEPPSFVGWPPVEGSEDWPGAEAVADAARPEDVVGTIGAALHRDTAWEPEAGDTAPVTRLSWIEVADGVEEEVEPSPPPRFVHRADPRVETQPHDASDDPALIGTTEDVLDEAVLREIVRAVLREELQGHLGERITRNIRKLVRAEINRSLTLRDYE